MKKFVGKVGLCLVRDCALDGDVGGQGWTVVSAVRDGYVDQQCQEISFKRPPEWQVTAEFTHLESKTLHLL